MSETIAVINTKGEVWPRGIGDTGLGPSTMPLSGPSLFSGSDDISVVALTIGYNGNNLYVITNTGAVWSHRINLTQINSGIQVPGNIFGGSLDHKYVVFEGSSLFYVITKEGNVWLHDLSKNLTTGYKLKGNSLFGGSDDKYVVFDSSVGNFGRILVITTAGKVWAHDLTRVGLGVPDTVGDGYMLTGPALWGNIVFLRKDKYVLCMPYPNKPSLLVVNTLGQVMAHDLSPKAIAGGRMLTGPSLFKSNSDDKYVVAYEMEGLLNP